MYNDLIRSVKNGRYKLIEYRNYTEKTELFDLMEDPNEIRNLSEDESLAHIKEEMRKLLIQYKESWGDEKHPLGKRYWQYW